MSESQQEIISGIKVYINEYCSDYAVMLNGRVLSIVLRKFLQTS